MMAGRIIQIVFRSSTLL